MDKSIKLWDIRNPQRELAVMPGWGGAGCQYQNASWKRAWFEHLKLKCDEQLLNVAFNFKVRRYTGAPVRGAAGEVLAARGEHRVQL